MTGVLRAMAVQFLPQAGTERHTLSAQPLPEVRPFVLDDLDVLAKDFV